MRYKIMRRTDLGKGERDDAIVVIDSILHQEPVWLGLLVQDRCGKLFPEIENIVTMALIRMVEMDV